MWPRENFEWTSETTKDSSQSARDMTKTFQYLKYGGLINWQELHGSPLLHSVTQPLEVGLREMLAKWTLSPSEVLKPGNQDLIQRVTPELHVDRFVNSQSQSQIAEVSGSQSIPVDKLTGWQRAHGKISKLQFIVGKSSEESSRRKNMTTVRRRGMCSEVRPLFKS